MDTARRIVPSTTPARRPGKKGLPKGALCAKRRLIPMMSNKQKVTSIILNGNRNYSRWTRIQTVLDTSDCASCDESANFIGGRPTRATLTAPRTISSIIKGTQSPFGGTQVKKPNVFITPAPEYERISQWTLDRNAWVVWAEL